MSFDPEHEEISDITDPSKRNMTRGGILGDVMGLGKTVECLGGMRVLDFLAEQGWDDMLQSKQPHLIVSITYAEI